MTEKPDSDEGLEGEEAMRKHGLEPDESGSESADELTDQPAGGGAQEELPLGGSEAEKLEGDVDLHKVEGGVEQDAPSDVADAAASEVSNDAVDFDWDQVDEDEFDWDDYDHDSDLDDDYYGHEGEEDGMSFLGHLEEFRWTVGRSILAFSGRCGHCRRLLDAACRCAFCRCRWCRRMARPSWSRKSLITYKPMGVFSVFIQVALAGGAWCLSMPFVLYFIACFIAPGLTDRERQGCAARVFRCVPAVRFGGGGRVLCDPSAHLGLLGEVQSGDGLPGAVGCLGVL